MPDLQGQPGELCMTIKVTRAATGQVETYELIGRPVPEEEENNGGDTLDGGTQRGD